MKNTFLLFFLIYPKTQVLKILEILPSSKFFYIFYNENNVPTIHGLFSTWGLEPGVYKTGNISERLSCLIIIFYPSPYQP